MAHRSRTRPLLAILVALASLALAAPARADVEVKRSEKGMTYSIRVPAGWDATRGGLLILGLHGQGGSHEKFMPLLEQAPFWADAVLVAPDATAGAAWEEGDIDLVADLAREVRARLGTLRTVALGFSRGAYLGFGLGLRHPGEIAAVIPHSGGLVVPVPSEEATKNQVFYVIHGDADRVVDVALSREAVKTLEGAGVKRVKYEEIRGLGHTINAQAVQRAFEWVQAALGPIAPALTDAQAAERLLALEKAVKAKEFAAAAEAFQALEGASRGARQKVAAQATKHAAAADETLAEAAVRCAATLGDAGLPALKAGLKSKSEPVAAKAAHGLGRLGGDPALGLLIGALAPAESAKKADLERAIHAALTRITGREFASAKEWKRWLAGGRA